MISTVTAQPAGFPKLPSIGIQVIPDASVRFLSMQNGETHTERYETSPTLIRTVQADPNLNLVVAPGVWLCYLHFNMIRVNDKVVRQAIALANNKDDMINSAMLGWGTKEYGIISNGWHPTYVSPRLLEGGDLYYGYEIEKANKLLDDAGYIDTDGNGIRNIPPEKQSLFPLGLTLENPEGTGFRKELIFTVRSLGWFPMSHKPTEILTTDVEQIGIKFDLSAEESAVMYPAIFDHKDFDIFTLATSQSPEFNSMLDLFYGPEYYAGGANDCGYNDPRFNELWKLAYTLPLGSDDHKEVIFEMQEMIQDEALWISWYTGDDTHVISAEFAGYEDYIMPGGIITDMNIWFVINAYNQMDPTKGFIIGFPGDIMQLNPYRTTDLRTQWYEILVYDSLVAYTPDLQVIPWLAEDFSSSTDGLDWSFTIREGVKWHDGTDLTPNDILWNFEFCYDNEVARYWPWLQYIKRDTLRVDGNTVKFSLNEPNTWFILGVHDLMIMNPDTYTGGEDWVSWEDPNPIASGPFMFEARVAGQTTQVVKNPDWWYTRPETITGPMVSTIIQPGTTIVSTVVVPEIDGSFLIAPVVMLGFALLYLARKRKK